MTRRGIANDGKAEGPEGSHIGCRASFFPLPFLRRRSCRHSRNNSGNSRSGLVWSGPAAILVQVIRLGAASSILSVSFLADIYRPYRTALYCQHIAVHEATGGISAAVPGGKVRRAGLSQKARTAGVLRSSSRLPRGHAANLAEGARVSEKAAAL